MDKKLVLSAPWYIYIREIKALFEKDPEIKIVFDEDNLEVKLYVDNPAKADALTQILAPEKIFGSISVKVTVIPANKLKMGNGTLYAAAFEGNPIFSHSSEFQGLYNQPITYVVFKKEVVQYFSDNLSDEHGITSTLYQDIAKDVIAKDGIYFCTDVDNESAIIKLEK